MASFPTSCCTAAWCLVALLPSAGAENAPSPIEIQAATVEFVPSRPDVTVGIAILNVFAPDDDWTVIVADGWKERFAGDGEWKVLELRESGMNRFDLPDLTIKPSQENSGPVCLSLKVWFNEIDNMFDSPFYQNVPDRYALVSWCSQDDPRAKARFSQNRVETLAQFRERLKEPIPLELKGNLVPWRPDLLVSADSEVFFHTLLVGRTDGSRYATHLKANWKLMPDGGLVRLPDLDRRIMFPKPEQLPELAADPGVARTLFTSRRVAAFDGKGNTLVAVTTRDQPDGPMQHRLERVDTSGERHVVAGSTAGFRDGKGRDAQFSNITAMTVGPGGILYVADGDPATGSRIRLVAPDGAVTTLAGGGQVGFADGPGEVARFHGPSSLAADRSGTLYVADPVNGRVRKVAPTGTVTTVAGGGEAAGTLMRPTGVAIGPEGALFILDSAPNAARVHRMSLDGELATIVTVDERTLATQDR